MPVIIEKVENTGVENTATETPKTLTETDIQKMIQSSVDKVRTDYVQKLSAKDKELEELKTQNMTELEKQQHELEKKSQELTMKENLFNESQSKIKALNILNERKLSNDLLPFIQGKSDEEVTKLLNILDNNANNIAKNTIDQKFKDSSINLKQNNNNNDDSGLFTREQIENMSVAEIRANMDKVNKSQKALN